LLAAFARRPGNLAAQSEPAFEGPRSGAAGVRRRPSRSRLHASVLLRSAAQAAGFVLGTNPSSAASRGRFRRGFALRPRRRPARSISRRTTACRRSWARCSVDSVTSLKVRTGRM